MRNPTILLAAVALCLCACATPTSSEDDATLPSLRESSTTISDEASPVVGRIQFRDRTVDMTVENLEANAGGVDWRTLKASRLIADIDPDSTSLESASGADSRGSELEGLSAER